MNFIKQAVRGEMQNRVLRKIRAEQLFAGGREPRGDERLAAAGRAAQIG